MDGILDIARWQFGITTVYHFLFVPLTIGLTALVATMETIWLRSHRPEWLRLTRFFGKLLLYLIFPAYWLCCEYSRPSCRETE